MKKWNVALAAGMMAAALAGSAFSARAQEPVSFDTFDVNTMVVGEEPNRLTLTGYFDKTIGEGRSAKLYIAEGARVATYVTVVSVPEGADTWQFLQDAGWIAYADEKQEAIYALEAGEGGYGSFEEEKAYVDAAMEWILNPRINDTPVVSTYAIFYVVGYGPQSAALEAWCAANPMRTISQAYVNSPGAPADVLAEIGQTPMIEAGRTTLEIEDDIKMTLSEVTIPVWYAANDPESIESLDFWKHANDVMDEAETDGDTAIYHQKQDSERWMTTLWNGYFAADPETYGPYGLSEVVLKTYEGEPDYTAYTDEISAFLFRYLSYDFSTEYDKQLSVRADWDELGVKTVVTEVEPVQGHAKREYLVYAPEGYEEPYGEAGAPLVLVEAGAGTTDLNFFNASQWWKVAQDNKFVLVFLCQDNNTPTTLTYHDFDIFQDKVIEEVTAAYKIDKSRIYMSGHSAGSGSSLAVSVLYPQEIAAFACTSAIPMMQDVPAAFTGMFGGAGREYAGPSNAKVPVLFMYGEGDRPELHDGIWHDNHPESEYYSEIDTTIEDLTQYHLGVWGLEMGEEGTETCDEYTYWSNVAEDRQHGYESWIWSVDVDGTAVPVYQVNRMQNIGHTNSNTEFPILWDYLKHFCVDENGVRYYSPSAFAEDDAVQQLPG